jgi:hypothetical protein
MGASQVPASSATASDNWVQISSVTPTAGVTTLSFTSIAGYKKLMLTINGVTLASSGNISLRLNNDSASNYVKTSSSAQSAFGTSILLNTNTASAITAVVEVNSTDNTGLKTLSGNSATTAVGAYEYMIRGLYLASASITQVNLVSSQNFNAVGTVALYGVAA